MSKVHCFLRITPANALFAVWVSLRAPVSAWHIALPDWMAHRFRRLEPHELFTRDQWLLENDACFAAWKAVVFPAFCARYAAPVRYAGTALDLSRNLWQTLGAEFERLYLFAAIVRKAHPAPSGDTVIVEPWLARAFTESELDSVFPENRFRRSAFCRWIEGCHEWAIAAAHLLRTWSQFALGVWCATRRLGKLSNLWAGISAQEIPDTDGKLDFTWAVRFGHLPADEVVYFPPCALDAGQRAFLGRLGVTWVEPRESFRVLQPRRRLRAVAGSSVAFARQFLTGGACEGPLVARFMARVPYWKELVEQTGAVRYFTSTSHSWPERAEVAVMAALGVRSAIWSYSANSIWFAKDAAHYQGTGIARSIVVSDEFWVWNEAVRRHYLRRQVSAQPPRIEITGAMMCGDARVLRRPPAEARRRLGLPVEGFLVAVFDVPTVDAAWRRRFGGGPVTIEPEFGEAFFSGIADLLREVPEVSIILKLKRGLGARFRPVSRALLELLEERTGYLRQGRILQVDVNCDPFLPIAACDGAIGMPCTSPVLATRALGKPAVFFDPLGIVGSRPVPALRELAVRHSADLILLLRDWVAGKDTGATHVPAELDVNPAWLNDRELFQR